MTDPKYLQTDHKVETVIANLLRAGVALSAAVVISGGVIYLAHHGSEYPNCRVFHTASPDLCTLRGIVSNASMLNGRGLIELGLLMLIATPVVRVAFSVFAFLRQRDRLYVVFTLIVLAILLFSMFGGMR